MTYLVEFTFVPRDLPNSTRTRTERVEANDPDGAAVVVRALHREHSNVVKGTPIQIRRIRLLPDYIVRADSSLSLFYPQNDAAREWLEDHVDTEAQWFGAALVVEHRYARDLVGSLQADGFTVGV